MKIFDTANECRQALKSLRMSSPEATLAFVPTMGALHEGHASLLRQAKKESDFVCCSIFVNPTQFDQAVDLQKYPKNLEADLELLSSESVDCLFLPNFDELYPDAYRYKVTENELSHELCGASRPGHFDGVLSVVIKLLNIVQPDFLFMGEKDWQQAKLIQGMIEAFFIPCKLRICPTVRDHDGLALSSRNSRLSTDARIKAALLPKFLCDFTKDLSHVASDLRSAGFEIDYLSEAHSRRFVAAYLEGVRLIDNVELPKAQNKEVAHAAHS